MRLLGRKDWIRRQEEILLNEMKARVALNEAEYLKTLRLQMAQYEHEFHYEKETRNIELAQLRTEIEAKKENIKLQNDLVAEKDKQIQYLQGIISSLSDALKLRNTQNEKEAL